MLAPIAVLQAAYEGMTWSGQPITCVPPATATDMQLIIDQLTVIQPGFNFETDANSRRVKQLLQLSSFMDKHCRGDRYVWQYQRYPSDAPPLPVAAHDTDVGTSAPSISHCLAEDSPEEPAATAKDAFSAPNLPWLPAPVPCAAVPPQLLPDMESADGSKQYAPFELLCKYAPDYTHAPVLPRDVPKAKAAVSTLAVNVRATVDCQECGKPRAVFSKGAVSQLHKQLDVEQGYAAKQLTMVLEDDPQFVCGAWLFPPEHTLSSAICCDSRLSCSSPPESMLYFAPAATLKSTLFQFSRNLCAHCGEQEVAEDRCVELGCTTLGPDTRQWRRLPLCTTCEGAGMHLVPFAKRRTKGAARRAAKQTKRARAVRVAGAAQREGGGKRCVQNGVHMQCSRARTSAAAATLCLSLQAPTVLMRWP